MHILFCIEPFINQFIICSSVQFTCVTIWSFWLVFLSLHFFSTSFFCSFVGINYHILTFWTNAIHFPSLHSVIPLDSHRFCWNQNAKQFSKNKKKRFFPSFHLFVCITVFFSSLFLSFSHRERASFILVGWIHKMNDKDAKCVKLFISFTFE